MLDAPDPEIERLYTCELGLERVPEWYGSLTALRTLDLGHNALVAVPDLSALTRLEILYLHDNALVELPALPSSLTYLNVGENPLAGLPALALPNLIELRVLDAGLTRRPGAAAAEAARAAPAHERADRGAGDGALAA